LECCELLLQRYRDEGDDFLLNIVNHYTSGVEAKAAVKSWIREMSEEIFSAGMKKLVRVGGTVLALTVTLLKNKYMLLKLKNYTFIYFLPDLAICFCSRSTSMCALLFSLPT
jgi:hypothetical protein